MFLQRCFWLLGAALFCLACNPDSVEPVACPPVTQALTAEQQTFLDICLGSEFGDGQERIRKWEEDVRVFVPLPHDSLEAELVVVMNELNDLSQTIRLSRVMDSSQANLIAYFGPMEAFATRYAPSVIDLVDSNFGIFTASWNRLTFEILRGNLCVDVVREPDLACQRHLLREELTQVLGMMNDVDGDPASIFFSGYRCSPGYTEQDRRFIRDFLSPAVGPGMCAQVVVEALF